LNFLKSILVKITTNDAVKALMKVIKLALSVAININAIIIGNTWKSIAYG